MQRSLILTKDGSHTIAVAEMNATYHSLHGAIRESMHVFIEAGLHQLPKGDKVTIFEMGFGTGLNALLTLIDAEKSGQHIHYSAIELHPLADDEIKTINYCDQLNRTDLQSVFQQLHDAEWQKEVIISDHFTLFKSRTNLLDFSPVHFNKPNLIYFDAFAPASQPELWTKEVFKALHDFLLPDGVLVTYCSKSDVRRAMQSAGFIIEKIPGPPGKREMVRARKDGTLILSSGLIAGKAVRR